MGPIWWLFGFLLLGANAWATWFCFEHASKMPMLYALSVIHVAWCVVIVVTMKRASR